jgi:hypothetical protein
MKSREEILRELLEIAPKLASLDKVEFYKVPEKYFTYFQKRMLDKVKTNEVTEELKSFAPNLSGLDKQIETPIPANYFTAFSSGVLNKIRANEAANELSQIAPVLSTLEKVNIYQAPANYFKALPQRLSQVVSDERVQQTATMPAWLRSINLVLESVTNIIFKPRYAFAFSGFAAVLIICTMVFINTQKNNDLNVRFASLSSEELDTYIANNSDDFQKSVLDVSTDEKKLLNKDAKGEINFAVTDEELNNALLD